MNYAGPTTIRHSCECFCTKILCDVPKNWLFVEKNTKSAKSRTTTRIVTRQRILIRLGLAKIGHLVHEICDFEDTGPDFSLWASRHRQDQSVVVDLTNTSSYITSRGKTSAGSGVSRPFFTNSSNLDILRQPRQYLKKIVLKNRYENTATAASASSAPRHSWKIRKNDGKRPSLDRRRQVMQSISVLTVFRDDRNGCLLPQNGRVISVWRCLVFQKSPTCYVSGPSQPSHDLMNDEEEMKVLPDENRTCRIGNAWSLCSWEVCGGEIDHSRHMAADGTVRESGHDVRKMAIRRGKNAYNIK